jgi:phenylacetyl-CoA:acceptor oxidoreductase subunit 2
LCRFSDAGNGETIHALGRPAFEKRQWTKSRKGVRGRCGELAVRGEGIEPIHQQHWDWKAATNFILGGSGASLFFFSVAFATPLAGFIGLGFVMLGLLAVLFKIGRPLRALYVLRQPQRSWMSREAWIAGGLFPLGVVYLLGPWSWIGWIAALAGIAFLVAQAMILKESRGIPAWRTPFIVPLIILCGLSEGAALLSLLHPLALVLAVLTALRGLSWFAYDRSVRTNGAPRRTIEVLSRCIPWMIAIGFLLPEILIALDFERLAAVAVLASGYGLKFILITRAAYQQGFAIQRGNGTVQPGWTFVEKTS